MPTERRKHKRVTTQAKGVYAAHTPEYAYAAPVMDISLGGFSFIFLANSPRLNKIDRVCISDDKNFIDNFPVKMVYNADFHLSRESYMKLRQYGFQFVDLTPTQKIDLELFVQKQQQMSQQEACQNKKTKD